VVVSCPPSYAIALGWQGIQLKQTDYINSITSYFYLSGRQENKKYTPLNPTQLKAQWRVLQAERREARKEEAQSIYSNYSKRQ
jgi:hypothetical protein